MTLVVLAVGMALSAAAALLLAPKPPKNPLDDSRTEPSHRGSLLGILLGHLRIGPVIGFVGGRWTRKEEVEGSGGKGGRKAQKQVIYFERGWHIVNLGEGRSLRKIKQGGKDLWKGEITPTTHPSGTSVDIGSGDKFHIYWGELDQPVNTALAGYTGANSCWPGVMYIWWDSKRLGTTARWPQLEYEITAKHEFDYSHDYLSIGSGSLTIPNFEVYVTYGVDKNGDPYSIPDYHRVRSAGGSLISVTDGSPVTISTGGSAVYESGAKSIGGGILSLEGALPKAIFEATTGTGWVTASGYTCVVESSPAQGANPASVLDQLLFDPLPTGAGLSRALFDTTLASLSTLMVSEELPCTVLLRSGRSWKDGIASVLMDIGALIYYDIATGLYGFKLLRGGEESSEISENLIELEKMKDTYAYSVLASNSTVFSFRDSSRDFARSTLPSTNDCEARYGADPNTKTVALETMTSPSTANKVANRRSSELSVDGATEIEVSYMCRPVIGNVVTLEGYATRFRIISVESNPDEASRKVKLLEDIYDSVSDQVPVTPVGWNPNISVAPDAATTVLEANRYVSKDVNGYYLLRIRTGNLAVGALVHDSPDDTTYDSSGEASAGSGGVLIDEIPEQTGSIISGYTFRSLNGDYTDIQDLSASEAVWRSGGQACLIGEELFYLSHVTGVVVGGETIITMHNLMRARQGSNKALHVADSLVFIFDPSAVTTLSKPWLIAGQNVYVKSMPYTDTTGTVITEANAASILPYKGGGYRPLPVTNLNTIEGSKAWIAGENVIVRWDYRSAVAGAGSSLSDVGTSVPSVEGYFRVTIKDSGGAVKRVVNTEIQYTYTQANIVADFGAEPASMTVDVEEVLNGLSSTLTSVDLERV